eukprot:6192222-Pleurochrysis_carterae.AAC.2
MRTVGGEVLERPAAIIEEHLHLAVPAPVNRIEGARDLGARIGLHTQAQTLGQGSSTACSGVHARQQQMHACVRVLRPLSPDRSQMVMHMSNHDWWHADERALRSKHKNLILRELSPMTRTWREKASIYRPFVVVSTSVAKPYTWPYARPLRERKSVAGSPEHKHEQSK